MLESTLKGDPAPLGQCWEWPLRLIPPRHCGAEQVVLVLVVLRCALDRGYPALSPLYPDLVFGPQLEGRVIETSDPNLDMRVGVGGVKEPRPTARTEAATVIA
jgi:hypothetical protein